MLGDFLILQSTKLKYFEAQFVEGPCQQNVEVYRMDKADYNKIGVIIQSVCSNGGGGEDNSKCGGSIEKSWIKHCYCQGEFYL